MEVLDPPAEEMSPTLRKLHRDHEANQQALQELLCKLHAQAPPLETDTPKIPEKPYSLSEEPRYVTGIGCLTFAELYAQTSRIVGSLLYELQQDFNPEDIDDCLQVAYLKLWQRLQRQPDCLADKPKRYIVRALLFACKAQRYAHHRHNRKQEFVASPLISTSFPFLTTNEIDIWLDIQQALHQVGEQLVQLDTPAPLLALYSLLTDVPIGEISTLYRTGYSTLIAARRQVKATLSLALPGYGEPAEPTRALFISQNPNPVPQYPKVTRWLCEREVHRRVAG